MNIEIILNKICDTIIENKEYLTDLDREIGDGDHGVNLARGASKIKENINKFKSLKPNEVLTQCAMLLMSNVGGASGALYASALLKGGMVLKGKDEITDKDIAATFNAMIEGVKARGKSTIGEKTMLDTLIPAYDAFLAAIDENKDLHTAWQDSEIAAKKGMESTKDIIATKGRAAYLGPRSIGHIDPGATSTYLIIKVIAENI